MRCFFMYNNDNIKENKIQAEKIDFNIGYNINNDIDKNMDNNINQNNVVIKKVDFQIYDNVIVKKVKHGNKLDVNFNTAVLTSHIKKLNKHQYVNLSDGEIKEFQFQEQKVNANLRKTFLRLGRLININFGDSKKDKLFITLTYKENMQDNKRLYEDAKRFIHNLKYELEKKYNKKQKEKVEFTYIIVAEPQERGAWHLHILLKANVLNLYISNIRLAKLWGHGDTKTERLKDVTNMGAYYVAYFTDVEKGKKGSRLHMYPTSFKIFRTSRNIIRPVVEEDVYKNIVKEYGKPTYSNSIAIERDNQVMNISTTEQFTKNSSISIKNKAIEDYENKKKRILDEYEKKKEKLIEEYTNQIKSINHNETKRIVNINVNTSKETFEFANEITINIDV